MNASDEPRECEDCLAIMALGTNIYSRCVKHQKHSDEPQEGTVCSVCGMDPLDRRGEGEVCTACGGGIDYKKRDSMWEQVGDLLTDENAPIIAAVLAEVARQEAGGRALAWKDYIEFAIYKAALEIREAMRLMSKGSA